ncbi:hypothetical protein SLA2020_181990 [Shorea laevis]
MLVGGFRWEVGEGSRVRFWRDCWVGERLLKDLCPRLFQLASNKEGMVREMGNREEEGWRWNVEWRRRRIGREQNEEQVMWELLDSIQIKDGVQDGWKWKHDGEGRYEVKKACEFLMPTESLLEMKFCKLIWCRLVPSKVSFFGWRLCLDRLPTKWNLQKRGVMLQGEDWMCGLCKEEVEDVNHLFCTCME